MGPFEWREANPELAKDGDARSFFQSNNMQAKAFKSLVEWTLRRTLGRNPTPTERIAARDELVTIFKAL
jgi:hypothetical protein